MKVSRRGQVSVEYLLVVGMAFLILLPAGYLFYTFSKASEDQIISQKIARAGDEIVTVAESMYAIGTNSWNTVDLNLPSNVRNIYVVQNSELVVEYETQLGVSEAVFFSSVNMTTPYLGGNISDFFYPGITQVKVASKGSYVIIQEIKT